MVVRGSTILFQVGRLGGYHEDVSFVVATNLIGLVRGRREVTRSYLLWYYDSPSQRYSCVDLSITPSLDLVSRATRASACVFLVRYFYGQSNGKNFAYSKESCRAGSQAFSLVYRFTSKGRLRRALLRVFRAMVAFLGCFPYFFRVVEVYKLLLPQGYRRNLGVAARCYVLKCVTINVLGSLSFFTSLLFCLVTNLRFLGFLLGLLYIVHDVVLARFLACRFRLLSRGVFSLVLVGSNLRFFLRVSTGLRSLGLVSGSYARGFVAFLRYGYLRSLLLVLVEWEGVCNGLLGRFLGVVCVWGLYCRLFTSFSVFRTMSIRWFLGTSIRNFRR